MDGSGYDVILWDWNGTLLDDSLYGLSIINSMLRRRGLPEPSREEHGRLFDFPVILYYERLGFDFEKEPFEVISHEFVDTYFQNVNSCVLREGTVEALGQIRDLGIRQSVLSASRQDNLERMISDYGLAGFFDELLGIDSIHAPGKSGRGCDWIRESGIDPARVLLIGDTMHDAEVAAEMGIDGWMIEGGHHPMNRLKETGCPCFSSLPKILQALAESRSKASPL
ncbi:HAD family hydrolase [Puniceicoccales bacterium CK1056]|uniref:phosphoglycolate phosphatase n=1 Tax=Oceanipulchritudo coccoides TaxID=2706888 RepID=A0A6B2LZX5_9BACT|nr:HAD family hydrolase [Oceanipulchritudo coccoides]NDV62261.1 HAD family hydrolase [Oceanipulchritudo coccoides]